MDTHTSQERHVSVSFCWTDNQRLRPMGARRDLQTGNPRAPRSALMKEKSGIIGGLVLQRGAPCWAGDNREITPP